MATEDERRRSFALRMDEIAQSVSADTIEAEMGAMCDRSLFYLLHQGAPISQADIDQASQAFTTLTDRLMPAALVHQFIQSACDRRIQPQIDQADLVPGFTDGETIAGGDAAVRLASPGKKFSRQEVLDCLQWNQAHPELPVAIIHLMHLIETYAEVLRNAVATRSPAAAEKLAGFARQWSAKNVVKFFNVAIFVVARQKAANEALRIDREVIADAVDLLNHSGAFTWQNVPSGPAGGAPLRIHCPAHAFLHKLVANEGALLTVLEYVATEVKNPRRHSDLTKSLTFIERHAISEEAGIRTFGQEWSKMKMDGVASDPME